MDHKGVNVYGRRSLRGIRVSIDREMFKECIWMMRMLKIELEYVKKVQWRRYVLESLNHSDEEVENEGNAFDFDEEEDPQEKLLKVFHEMKGRIKWTCLPTQKVWILKIKQT